MGFSGASLGLLLGLCAFTAGVIGVRGTLLVRRAPSWLYGPVLALLVAGSVVLVWVQPAGPGLGGLLIAIVAVMVARMIPAWVGVILLVAAALFTVGALTGFLGPHTRQHWSGVALTVVSFIAPVVAIALYALWQRAKVHE